MEDEQSGHNLQERLKTREGVIAYVQEELQELGQHWTRQGDLRWTIYPAADPTGEYTSYTVFVSPDIRAVIVTHSNSDTGYISLHLLVHNATLIDFNVLGVGSMSWVTRLEEDRDKPLSLSALIREVIKTKEPNRYGIT